MTPAMIDFFALALSHGLLALACWRILRRGDLDAESEAAPDHIPVPPPAAQPKPGLRPHA